MTIMMRSSGQNTCEKLGKGRRRRRRRKRVYAIQLKKECQKCNNKKKYDEQNRRIV
jgi:hypothetical protein